MTGVRDEYLSLLVDIQELRSRVRGPDHGGYTAVALKDRMQTTDRVARKLIAEGHLKSVTVVNPINRCPTVIVPSEEVERFEAEYVSLFALARRQGRHHMVVKKDLDAVGVRPAMDPEKIGATFYRRKRITGTDAAKTE